MICGCFWELKVAILPNRRPSNLNALKSPSAVPVSHAEFAHPLTSAVSASQLLPPVRRPYSDRHVLEMMVAVP